MALDWWDQDSRHPANGPFAEYFHKTFIAKLENGDGEELTFIITAGYRVDERGTNVDWYDFWPHDESMRASVEAYLDL